MSRLPIILLFAVLPFFAGLRAQSALDPDSRAALYEKPQALIDPAVITQLEAELEAPVPSYDVIIARAREQLDRYYSQFVEDKLTEDERRNEPLSYAGLSANALRRVLRERERLYGRSYFQGESPYLFRLHRILGRAYSSIGSQETDRALAEFSMALRYTGRDLAMPADLPVPVGMADEDPAAADAAAREQRYMLMLRTFADPDRIAQEPNAAIATAAQNFRGLMEEYARLKPELAEAGKTVDVVQSMRLRGVTPPVSAEEARRTLDELRNRRNIVLTQMEEIRFGPYRVYLREKQSNEGDTAYRMAEIADQFGSRSTLLQLAHQLDPVTPLYIDELVEIYRRRFRWREAIAFQERYLEVVPDPADPAELAPHYLRLAQMYSAQKNAIRAAEAYEEYLERAPESDERRRISLGIADLHFAKTGRLDRARDLYAAYLAAPVPDIAALSVQERTLWRAERFRIYSRLAAIHRRQQRSVDEATALSAAREAYLDIDTEYQAVLERERALRKEIQDVKRSLLNREDEALQRQYYELQRIDLPAIEADAAFLRSRLLSLDYPAILERQAFLAHQQRRFADALSIYRELIQRGDGAEVNRARQNIDRINLTMSDGRVRQPVVDPRFER